jgi:hypothetical protein
VYGGLAYRPAATELCGVEMRIAVLCQNFETSVGERNQMLVEGTNYEQRFYLINTCVSVTLKTDQQNEMGGACSAYGGEKSRIQGFGGET